MVNDGPQIAVDIGDDRKDGDRKERARAGAALLASQSLNPFGDLHTLQHLSALFARSMRAAFEPVLRREMRVWAEPLVVQRFADYRAERPETLAAWLPLSMAPTPGRALMVIDGKFVLELLDQFFGGTGEAPNPLPNEFSPAAEAMIARVGAMLAPPLRRAWEPLARIDFAPGQPESNPALLTSFDAEDAVIVTRFGLSSGGTKPNFIDICYPVLALKPHAPQLTGKVHSRTAAPDPAWRNGLTRAVMGVRFPIRSVLAEPVISLAQLMELKEGDVIPVSFGAEVPVMVGRDRLGLGTVGAANGRAAVKLNRIERRIEEDFE